ncbi:MAG: internal scaffolding protein [Arizlama microvirus]|nr:MAG: internal scaffolding protein [Arizlama microvirus]
MAELEENKMSKEYLEKFGDTKITRQEMKAFLKPQFEPTLTEQAHKDVCNVNKIIKKYDKTGLISHVSKVNAQYGDVSGMEFRQAVEMIMKVNTEFAAMPSEVRSRFKNDPANLLNFMSNPLNRDEAIKIGLIKQSWTKETDGVGEKVALGENKDVNVK